MLSVPLIYCKNLKALPFFLIFLFATSVCIAEDVEWHRVQEVLSGDKLRLQSGSIVTLSCILAPPVDSRDKIINGYSKRAKSFLQGMVLEKDIRVEWSAQLRNTKGEYQVYAFLRDGTFVNEEIIRAGFAKLNILPPNLKYAENLRDASRQAHKQSSGLWVHANTKENTQIFVANAMTNKFHLPNCEEMEGVPRSQIRSLDSRLQAKQKKYQYCKICRQKYQEDSELY